MSSLIIALIAILLVILLAAVGIYYGGPALSKASLGAQVDSLINQGTQIKGAASLFSTDHPGDTPTDVTQLQDQNYLSSAPAGWSVASGSSTVAYTAVHGTELCLAYNVKYNVPPGADGLPPLCTDVPANTPACCR